MTAAAGPETLIDGTVVVVGEAGVLIRGRSGAGKSRLALALLDTAAARALHARLVGDDRVAIQECHGRIVAAPHPTIAGTIERRGTGILGVEHQPRAVVRLIVDLIDADSSCDIPPRMPSPEQLRAKIGSVVLSRLMLRVADPTHDAVVEILRALRAMQGSG